MASRVWTPALGSVRYDLVWFNTNLTYKEWGEVTDALATTQVGMDVVARFNSVVTCPNSGLSAQEELYSTLEDKPLQDDGRVVVESFRCLLHPGKTMADSDAALDVWKPAFTKAVAATGASVFVARRIPIVSGTGFDLSYIVAWDDATTYAAGNEAYRADPASANADALFNAAHRCESSLFESRTVVPAPD